MQPDAPLDLDNPAHLDALKRAYERFPEIGGRSARALCPDSLHDHQGKCYLPAFSAKPSPPFRSSHSHRVSCRVSSLKFFDTLSGHGRIAAPFLDDSNASYNLDL
nr:DUF5953 family protein [Melittangium boletus]